MRTNKVILVSLLVTGIAGKASSFHKFGGGFDLLVPMAQEGYETQVKPSYMCYASGCQVSTVPNSGSLLGCVSFEKNTGVCLFAKDTDKNVINRPFNELKLGVSDNLTSPRMFFSLKGPYDITAPYTWSTYTSGLNNIKIVKRDDLLEMDADNPSVKLIETILDSKGEDLAFKEEFFDESTKLKLRNMPEGNVTIIANVSVPTQSLNEFKDTLKATFNEVMSLEESKELTKKLNELDDSSVQALQNELSKIELDIDFRDILLSILEPSNGKELLEKSNILSVWWYKTDGNKETYIGLAQTQDGKELFHWATEIDLNESNDKLEAYLKEEVKDTDTGDYKDAEEYFGSEEFKKDFEELFGGKNPYKNNKDKECTKRTRCIRNGKRCHGEGWKNRRERCRKYEKNQYCHKGC